MHQQTDLENDSLISKNSTSSSPIKFTGEPLAEFKSVTPDEVRKIVNASPTKSCSLDPIPTWLLKECLDYTIPILTLVINASLNCAEFPSELKKAFITPLIKKA